MPVRWSGSATTRGSGWEADSLLEWGQNMLHPLRALASVVGLLACTTPLFGGGVRLEVRPDGTQFIVNEASAFRSSRLSWTLRQPNGGSGISELIDQHARAASLEPRLVQAVIQVESGYNPRAQSNKGAKGLMQLIDGTASDVGVTNPYDPADNIRGGVAYLRKLYDEFGELELALAAYNAGPGAVTKYGGIPPYRETQEYVAKVLHLYDGSYPMPASATDRIARGPSVRLGRDGGDRILITNVPAARRP